MRNGHLLKSIVEDAYDRLQRGEGSDMDRLLVVVHEEQVRTRGDLVDAIRQEGRDTRRAIHEESRETRKEIVARCGGEFSRTQKLAVGGAGMGGGAGIVALVYELVAGFGGG